MDTMAFVEKFLQSHDHYDTCDMEERTFKSIFGGKFVNIQLQIYCPEINEEENVYYDEITSLATLNINVPEDKTGNVVAYIHQVGSNGDTFSKLLLPENRIVATHHFLVWDKMSDDQLDLMIFKHSALFWITRKNSCAS